MDDKLNNNSLIPKIQDNLIEASHLEVIMPDLEANRQLDLVLKDAENKKKKLDKVLEDINLINDKNRAIKEDYYSEYMQEENFIKNMKYAHDMTMLFINELGIYIWRGESSRAVYYRIGSYGKK